MPRPEPYLYGYDDETSVEVLVDDCWWPAELRMRSQRPDGSYEYNAAWTRDGDTHLDTFHQDHVRPDTVDRTAGRG
jgi:hypothetical protein